MSVKPFLAYVHSIADSPGVAGLANTYMSVLNPANSGVLAAALLFDTQTYAIGATAVASSLKIYRITAHSGGTLLDPATVNRFHTTHPNPACTVRVDNPSITTVGPLLRGVSPVISTGAGAMAPFATQPPGGASFIFHPGEGMAFRTDDGDVDVRWNMTYVWAEFS